MWGRPGQSVDTHPGVEVPEPATAVAGPLGFSDGVKFLTYCGDEVIHDRFPLGFIAMLEVVRVAQEIHLETIHIIATADFRNDVQLALTDFCMCIIHGPGVLVGAAVLGRNCLADQQLRTRLFPVAAQRGPAIHVVLVDIIHAQ